VHFSRIHTSRSKSRHSGSPDEEALAVSGEMIAGACPCDVILGVDIVRQVSPLRQGHPADTNLRPMSNPLGEKTLATRGPCRSRSTASQRSLTPAVSASRADRGIVRTLFAGPAPERLVQFGRLDAVQAAAQRAVKGGTGA
jgi:hypothetical protein